jgi:hypothetical protein
MKILLRRCLCIGFVFIVAQSAAAEENKSQEMELVFQDFVREMESVPAWFNLEQETLPGSGQPLVEACERIISKLPQQDSRRFVDNYMRYAKNDPPIEKWSKIFIFNRIVANVPEWDAVPEGCRFGAWHGPIDENGKYNILFPLKLLDGIWKITNSAPPYQGPDYRGVDELDFFIKQYGFRTKK